MLRASIGRLQKKIASHDHHRDYFRASGVLGSGVAMLTLLTGGPATFATCMLFGMIFSPAVGMWGIELGRFATFARLLAKDCREQLEVLSKSISDAKEVP